MSIQKNNVVMFGNSGMFAGQVVFRIRNGQTILCAPPRIDPNRKPTASQQLVLDKFKLAAGYGKKAISVPATKAAYLAACAVGQSPYNRSVADFFIAPTVHSIDKSNYIGQSSDYILVNATDDFKVARVKISIHSASGELVEEGNAVMEENGADWRYAVTGENENAVGSKITATAYDLPGNEHTLEITV